MEDIPEILVVRGQLKDRRFVVPVSGLRVGRSSTCEISIHEPELSRNHCLFETRDGQLWVTDLASANGTLVNGQPLGADSLALQAGDLVEVGDSALAIVKPGAMAVDPQTLVDGAENVKVDLGLDGGSEAGGGSGQFTKRMVLWVGAAAAVAAAAAVILSSGGNLSDVAPAAQALPEEKPVLRQLRYEKVEADGDGIYRYALSLDDKGMMAVEIDDVPKENRHVRKSARLSPEALSRLVAIVTGDELFKLDPEYTGEPLVAGTLKSLSLQVIYGSRVFSVSTENAQEPAALRRVREQLETFSKNELGIWAIQFSAEKLVEMSAESRRVGDAKWEERDVQHGNLSAALIAYDEAVFYLDTVNPKPADYGKLVKRREEVAKELDRRYRDQRFLADRAINLGDWAAAKRELRVLCDLVPSPKDPRHDEARSKLLDVESRVKKGGGK